MVDRLDDSLLVLENATVPLTRATGDLWTQALALDRAARFRIMRGEFSEASADIEHGMALGWQLDDELVSGLMTFNRGVLRFYLGEWRQAQADLRWASAVLHLHQASSRTADVVAWLGRLSLAKGHWERAEYELRRCLVLAEISGETQTTLRAHCVLAERDLVEGRPEEARIRLEPLLVDARRGSVDVTAVLALLGWAQVQLGDGRQSESLVAASVMRAAATGLRCVLVDALRIQALVAAHAGRWQETLADIEEALALAHALPYPYGEAKAHSTFGQLLLRRNEPERGYEHLAAARAILAQLGERLYAREVEQLSAAAAQSDSTHG
jgi:tetratricopeptide (TPR) repeat protein